MNDHIRLALNFLVNIYHVSFQLSNNFVALCLTTSFESKLSLFDVLFFNLALFYLYCFKINISNKIAIFTVSGNFFLDDINSISQKRLPLKAM
jgi:hypothetical protein